MVILHRKFSTLMTEDWLERIFSSAFFVGVSAIVAWQKLSAVAFLLCLLIALPSLFTKKPDFKKVDYLFITGLLLYPVVASVSLLSMDQVKLSDFDTIVRFVLCIPLYCYVRTHAVSLKSLLYAALCACIFSFFISVYDVYVLHKARADAGINAITYGQICVISSFYALMSLSLVHQISNRKTKILLSLVILLVAMLGLLASVLSGSRGPLAVVPLLMILSIYGLTHVRIRKRTVMIVAISLLGVWALLQSRVDVLRVNEAVSDIQMLQQGNAETSIGIRTQVWRASWHLFQQKPIFGHGKDDLIKEIKQQQAALGVSPGALNYHAHNDYLQLLAELGVVGLVAILFLYLGSMSFVSRQGVSPFEKSLIWGICLCWLTFGLTQTQLMHQRITLLELLILTFVMAYVN